MRGACRLLARRKELVESIIEGVPGSEVKDELTAIPARREQRQQCCHRRAETVAAPRLLKRSPLCSVTFAREIAAISGRERARTDDCSEGASVRT